jgi:hypothetical protein
MPRVTCDSDRQRSVGASTQLAIDPPIGLQRHKVLRRVEAASGADGRHKVRVAGHEDDRIAQVSADELEQLGAERYIGLLLLPADEPAATQRTNPTLGFEMAEMELHSGLLEGRVTGTPEIGPPAM